MGPRGRYAPSPTGALHLGNARTALLAWLDIRSQHGVFVLRMEDLDPARSSAAFAEGILRDLHWLGIDWDEGPDVGGPHAPYEQSRRDVIYRQALDRLVAAGSAYPCSCSRGDVARASNAPHVGEDGPCYPGTCREGPVRNDRPVSFRLRVEPGARTFVDLVHGPQSFDLSASVGDFVIRRSDGVAAYQLAVALDDALMCMNRVVRGDDLLSSTPRQLVILDALHLKAPLYGHVPLLMDTEGHRLAKREGALTLDALRERGVTPEAIVGFLLGKAGIGNGRPRAAGAFVEGFSLKDVQREPAPVTDAEIAALLR